MPERLLLSLDNRFEVPPDYAMAWLTDFREDDMQAVGGPRMPSIRVTRLPDGRLQREFAMMGLRLTTRTTLETRRWVALVEAKDRKGRLASTGRVVETVREADGGTAHRVDLYQEDHTLLAKVVTALTAPVQKAQIRKLFRVQKEKMEEAYRAGKPPTA